jgi:transcriptional regulator with XRE-family HTH domain
MDTRSEDHVALGRTIRELRRDRGLSQERLAELAGMHRTYVGGIERGERNVSFANLRRLAGAMDVHASAFFAPCQALVVQRPHEH